MFKEKDLILYPNHGVGEIIKLEQIARNGKNVDYYDIVFFDTEISISVPVNGAKSLGLSLIPTKKEILKALTKLGDKVEINEEIAKDIREITTKDLNTTEINKIVELVNSIRAYNDFRDKPLGVGLHKVLTMSKKFLKSVVDSLLEENAIENYPTVTD
jgi:CarD family transcriptional regulator